MIQKEIERVKNSIVELNIKKAKKMVTNALKIGTPPYEIITKAISPALREIGEKYECGELFIADLIASGSLAKELLPVILHNIERKAEKVDKAVIGTVKGDIHDIGKNIFGSFLIAYGFEVYDLGVDVPAKEFVNKVKEVNAKILGLSVLLTSLTPELKNVIDELKRANLRGRVKVIVGGRGVTKKYAKQIGADAYAEEALEGAKLAVRLLGNQSPK